MTSEGWKETQAKCLPLKMLAADGKYRLTDAADTETVLRIVQSVPSPKAEPFKQWLAKVGNERLQETGDPSLAADRMRREYERLGYPDAWINERLKNVVARDGVTAEWRERGAREGRDFAVLTDRRKPCQFTGSGERVFGLEPVPPLRYRLCSLS